MAGGFIPAPRQPADIQRDFERMCRLRADAIERWQGDIAVHASVRIDQLLDEYLQERAR